MRRPRQAVLDRQGRVLGTCGEIAPPLDALTAPGADLLAACAALARGSGPEASAAAALGDALEAALGGRVAVRELIWELAGGSWRALITTLAGDGPAAALLSLEQEDCAVRCRELELFKAIYERSTDAIALIDPQGRYLSQNSAHRALIGFSDEELAGQTPAIHMGEVAFRDVASELAAQGSMRGEFPVRDREGRPLVVGLTAFSLYDPEGQVVCHVGIKRDVTARRAAESELRLRAELQRALNELLSLGLEELPLEEQLHCSLVTLAGVSSLPLAPHAAAYLDGALRSLVGLESEALPAQVDAERCPCGRPLGSQEEVCPGDPAGPAGLAWPHLALPLVAAGRTRGVLLLFVRQGSWPAEGRPFLRAAASALAAVVARRHAEEQVREGAVRLREIAQALPGVVFQLLLRPDGTTQVPFASGRLHELFGIDPGELVQGDPFRFVEDADRNALLEGVVASASALTTFNAEVRVTHRVSGESRWAMIRSHPRGLPDGGVLWNGVALDVTDRRRAEAELQRAKEAAEAADRAKSQFLANVSHEIRTPLNAVIGMTALLERTPLDPQQRDYARTIHTGGAQLLTLIDDLLDFARFESERMELERRPFSLRECVEGAMALVAERAAHKGLDLAWLEEGQPPAWIMGDSGRLRQVLVNLLGNAVKFTERGEVTLTVTAPPAAGGASQLRFEVRDTGVGIPSGRMDRLFRAFSQVDPSTTRQHGGTGLGLAICKRIVEQMGGEISASSSPGEGSRFWFRIPVVTAPAPTGEDHAALRGQRLLVGAAHDATRRMLVGEARRLGLEVTDHGTTAGLLRALRESTWDAALLDEALLADGRLQDGLRAAQAAGPLPLLCLYAVGTPPPALVPGLSVATRLMKPPALGQLGAILGGILGQPRPAASPAAPPPAPAGAGPRILVAEDLEVNRRVATALLGHLGLEADLARDGEEACALCEARAYDLVLMDLQMPRMDGLSAARRIRSRHAPGSGPRIVAITASALEEDRERCRRAGIDEVLVKPIGLRELEQLLQRVLPPPPGGEGELLRELAEGPAAQLGPAGLRELVEVFLADAPGLMTQLRQAVAAGSAPDVKRAAHSLKGSCLTLGVSGAAAICEQIEREARAGQVVDSARLHGLEREMGRAEVALLQLIG